MPDAGDAATAQARAKFDRDVLPIVTSQCGACHAGTSNGWMAGNPGAYTAMLAWPQLVDTSSPTSSFLLSKGTHEGPALSPDDKATIVGWIQLEMTARSGRGTTPKTDTVDVAAGPNSFALDSVGAVGSTLTFTAQKLTQGLYLSRISITAGAGGVHITHPLFVTWQDTTPSPDPVDSFDTVDLDVAAGMTGGVGGGLLMLENVSATAKLNIVFQKVGPAKGTAPPPPSGCKAVASFTTNARAPLSQSCVSCHGGGNVGASNATDMTKINDTTAAGQTTACGQILGRVDLVNPAASGILVAPDPASGASHPFKFPSAAAFTAFKTSLSTWITAEKAAP
jgi:mono/diheme cytochrome c family protein